MSTTVGSKVRVTDGDHPYAGEVATVVSEDEDGVLLRFLFPDGMQELHLSEGQVGGETDAVKPATKPAAESLKSPEVPPSGTGSPHVTGTTSPPNSPPSGGVS